MTRAGHTLLEVLVALVVSSVAIAALAATSRASLRSGVEAARLDAAGRLAASALEEHLARPPEALAAGRVSESIVAGGEPLEREVTLAAGPRPDLWRIAVSVRDRRGVAARLETLRRVPWRPAP